MFPVRPLSPFLALMLSACAVEHPSEHAFFDDFLEAVEARNDEALAGFMLHPEHFFPGGVMDQKTTIFTYDGEGMRQRRPDLRSLMEFLGEPYEIFPQAQRSENSGGLPEDRIVFVVVLRDHVDEMEAPDFFAEQWMISYFACEFYLTETGYKM